MLPPDGVIDLRRASGRLTSGATISLRQAAPTAGQEQGQAPMSTGTTIGPRHRPRGWQLGVVLIALVVSAVFAALLTGQTHAQEAPRRFTGTAPAPGGRALLVAAADSSPRELSAALEAAGCSPVSLALLISSKWSVYIAGAPAAVNAAFGTLVRASTPFFVRCSDEALMVAAPGAAGPSASGFAPLHSAALRDVESFAYVLSGIDGEPLDLDPLMESQSDLVIIDYSRDGTAAGAFTREEIAALRDGGRIALAYLSIGEAESYRGYWDAAWDREPPAWLGPENPEWEGNFKVRYWMPAWQEIVLAALDDVIDTGFDGVYLDIIDAYEFFGPDGPRPEREDAAELMAQFVERIAAHARVTRGQAGFLVVPQNGPAIIDEISDPDGYLSTIDAIGAEDTFYFGEAAEDNPLDVQDETLALLHRFRGAGVAVLAVEYLTRDDLAADFHRRAVAAGFLPYVGVRALDRLVEQPR